ncbi:MAG: alpha/beta hydrolase [Chloroflexi bacterium HGW-Chloroflexi-10]|nr:MAG: alpha/beta hydrolase [Chloroflexi bacterium HGW-Chloroflexi-10]
MIKRILWIIPVILVLLVAAFIIWGNSPAKPEAAAFESLQSNAQVNVVQSSAWISFIPVDGHTTPALIFYPGGRVDYRAYAPLLNAIAEKGTPIYLVKMPLNLAVFGINKADQVIQANPQYSQWAIGGHSLGGAMAANYARNNPDEIDAMILWASYPAESDDFSTTNLSVLSISGTLDGLSTPEKIQASAILLPTSTVWEKIEGGNHAQFGSYGAQPGDNPPGISEADQQKRIIEATSMFLSNLP